MAHVIRQKPTLRAGDVFLELVSEFPLKPIRTSADHEAASRVLRRLVLSKPEGKFTAGERDYLEALTILVRDYQQKQRAGALAKVKPLEIIRHLMEENGMSVTDLGSVIGSRTAASMILNGRRSPSKRHVLRLAERFGVDASAFLVE